MKRRLLLQAGLWIGICGAVGFPIKSFGQARTFGGTVLHFRPPASDYVLLRAGRRLPVSTFMVLEPADELRLAGSRGSLTLKDGDLPAITLRAGDQPYFVRGRARRTLFDNLRALLLSKVKADDEGLPMDGGSRDGELTLPFADLIAGTSILDSRTGSFFAAWNGGAPPYRFRLKTVGGSVLIDERGLAHGRLAITSRSVALRPGFYLVEVGDSKGSSVSGQFEVRLPALASLPHNRETADAIRLYDAVTLAVEQPGRRFEAFQRLAALRNRRPEAARLADWLGAGGAAPARVSP